MLSICAVSSGADGWEAIEEFGKEEEDWLRQYIPLENGVPSHPATMLDRVPMNVIDMLLVIGFIAK